MREREIGVHSRSSYLAISFSSLFSFHTGSDAVETRTVAQILRHPDYLLVDDPRKFRLRSDVMLVRLTQPSNEPIAQWNNDPSIPNAGGTVQLVGFGRTDGSNPNSVARNLLTTTVTAFDDSTCADIIGEPTFAASQNFCYGSRDATVCNGDSGSPVFDTGTGVIVGLNSYGDSECSSAAVGAEVSTFAEWIQARWVFHGKRVHKGFSRELENLQAFHLLLSLPVSQCLRFNW